MPNIFDMFMTAKVPVISEEAAQYIRDNNSNPYDQAEYLNLLRQAANENYISDQQVLELFELNQMMIYTHQWYVDLATIWQDKHKAPFQGDQFTATCSEFLQQYSTDKTEIESLNKKFDELSRVIESTYSDGKIIGHTATIYTAILNPEAKAEGQEAKDLNTFLTEYEKTNKTQEIINQIAKEATQALEAEEAAYQLKNEEIDNLLAAYQNYLAEKIYFSLSSKEKKDLGLGEMSKAFIGPPIIQPILEDHRERQLFSSAITNSDLKIYIARFEAIENARSELANTKLISAERFHSAKGVFQNNAALFEEEKDSLGKRILKSIVKFFTGGKVDFTTRNKKHREQIHTFFKKPVAQLPQDTENNEAALIKAKKN